MSQTWEKLQEVLRQLGHEPKKSLGQNFLVSDVVIDRIIQAAQSFSAQSLIEIGPGPGALTWHLKEQPASLAGFYQVIELDHSFAQYWRDQGLIVHEIDALHFNWSEYLQKTKDRILQTENGLSQKYSRILVSNLPYQISSSLVIDRSLDSDSLEGMVLMFQKEVAQRIRATMKDDCYGMLSVVAQTFWDITTVTEAGPRDFFPPPRIASRVLKFVKKSSESLLIEDRRFYFRVIKAAFLRPRKLVISNFEQGGLCSKETALEIIQEIGLKDKTRAEEISIPQYALLYEKFKTLSKK